MDEVYDWAEDQRRRPSHFEQEVDSIVRQGLDSKHKREYIDRETLSGVSQHAPVDTRTAHPTEVTNSNSFAERST